MASVKDRIFTRTGKNRQTERFYIDLRDLGQGQKALKMPGERYAVTDEETAVALAEQALEDALQERRNRAKTGIRQVRRLEEYAKRHIRLKEESGEVEPITLDRYRLALLDDAVSFFGSTRRLDSIDPTDLEAYVEYLRREGNGRGGTLSKATIRGRLNCLSNLFKRAVSEGAAPTNPVANMFKKPTPERTEADFLEVPEAALVLEAARLHQPDLDAGGNPNVHAILATFFLTGMRRAELLGLEVRDVDWERDQIHVRPNRWRRLKNEGSERVVPLWPQLRTILRDYIFGREEPLDRLLFPSNRTDKEKPISDLRRQLDAVGELAGLEDGRLRTRLARHTYISARLQTVDNGQPVAPFTVAREVGHSSPAMIMRVYGHLLGTRIRSEEVRYDPDEFPELEDRLQALREAS